MNEEVHLFVTPTSSSTSFMTTYRNPIGVLLPDSLGLSLALLEGMLVFELGPHVEGSADVSI